MINVIQTLNIGCISTLDFVHSQPNINGYTTLWNNLFITLSQRSCGHWVWRKRWKWYILVTIIQTCFILIYAIISSHLSLVIDTDIVKNHKFGIPANAALLNCNGTKVTFWSQWWNMTDSCQRKRFLHIWLKL